MTLNNLFCCTITSMLWVHSYYYLFLMTMVLSHHVSITKRTSTIVLQNKKRKLQTIYISQSSRFSSYLNHGKFIYSGLTFPFLLLTFYSKITAHLLLFESSHSGKKNPAEMYNRTLSPTIFKMSIRILKGTALAPNISLCNNAEIWI